MALELELTGVLTESMTMMKSKFGILICRLIWCTIFKS